MLGQLKLKHAVTNCLNVESFPPLVILIGDRGCGKKTAARYISTYLQAKAFYISGCKVDEVRETLEQAYNQVVNVFYFFPDAENMNIQAQNALLKICEEPPHKAKIIISVNHASNILDTLKSRAFVYQFVPYDIDDLVAYAKENKFDLMEKNHLLAYANTPGQIKLVNEFDFKGMVAGIDEFVKLKKFSAGFALVKKLKFKDEDEGYDPFIFMRALEISLCKNNKYDDKIRWALAKISGVRQCLAWVGINKKMLFENLIVELDEVL